MSERLVQLEELLKESPTDPFLHYAITMEHVKLGDDSKSKQGFENLVSEFPNYLGTYYHFGKFLEKTGDTSRAITIYEQGMELAKSLRNMHALGELRGAHAFASGFDDENDEDFL